ncbi:ROK family transcriptional regulator [Nakamurella flavida]|uniref:ROK family transcriptional regulator n=1 Tax=Nakamurella flavida TaxID=363630 RepID=A0A938YLF9_9ACTN|nr:ROK family transcriptional regulator [Nakamurella flavida]MBM9476711.1 ROK family transcriptional regulator [Nakamurella flavida]MDP9778851.1 putative NBD/HSP70 family sugar kinase [Nakamurella flavida]
MASPLAHPVHLRTAPARADQATVRRLNLSLLIGTLAGGGPRSRARLAEDTGLTKATVSSLVAELTELGLVTEGDAGEPHRGLGRPGRVLHLNADALRCVGVEVNIDFLAAVVLDLAGRVLARRRIGLSVVELGPARTMGRVAELVRELVDGLGADPTQVHSVVVSLPGLVEVSAGMLAFAPNLSWRDVDIAHTLSGRLGWPDVRVAVDNDANLGAIAEYAAGGEAGSPHLVYLAGEAGVGAGIIEAGQILRGASGFAGEVGHIPVGPAAAQCGCGRRGCWETGVGLAALLAAFPIDDEVRDPTVDLTARLEEVARRADRGDPRAETALADQGRWLGIGCALLANVLDPEVIVLGGHYPPLRRHLEGSMRAEMTARTLAGSCRVEFSRLGFDAASLGAAHAGIRALLDDPTQARPGAA